MIQHAFLQHMFYYCGQGVGRLRSTRILILSGAHVGGLYPHSRPGALWGSCFTHRLRPSAGPESHAPAQTLGSGQGCRVDERPQQDRRTRLRLWLISGFLWFPLVSFGFLWFPLVSFGFLWFPLVSFGFLWFALVCFGFLWFPLVSFGFLLVVAVGNSTLAC